MRLYTDNTGDVEVLLGALKLQKRLADSAYQRAVCDKLIARIEKCQELQRPNCNRKDGRK